MANPTRIRKINIKFTETVKGTQRVVANAFREIAVDMNVDIQNILNKKWPPASTPGNAPARRTGFLRGNTKVTSAAQTITIRTPNYGTWLEGGTTNMLARPFIAPTIRNKQRFWQKKINSKIKKAMKAKGKPSRKKRR